jgi:hypothetical protein
MLRITSDNRMAENTTGMRYTPKNTIFLYQIIKIISKKITINQRTFIWFAGKLIIF